MKTKSIKQQISFAGSPGELYDIWLNPLKQEIITGGKVKISKDPKGSFEAFDGYVHGYHMELIPGKKIEQAWYFAEDGWPENHYSICTLLLAKTTGGCKITFTQTGVPEHKVAALKEGWKTYYWKPIKQYLAMTKGK